MSEQWHYDDRIVGAHVWYSHVRVDGRLVRTVAAIESGDDVHVGVSIRHPNDHSFSKKLGRSIAGGRARFALAKALGLTEREGRFSRYDTILTLPKTEFVDLARELGVNLPEHHAEVAAEVHAVAA